MNYLSFPLFAYFCMTSSMAGCTDVKMSSWSTILL